MKANPNANKGERDREREGGHAWEASRDDFTRPYSVMSYVTVRPRWFQAPGLVLSLNGSMNKTLLILYVSPSQQWAKLLDNSHPVVRGKGRK